MLSKSVIREMFYGKKGTYEQITLSKEFRAAEKIMHTSVDSFLETLNNEQKKTFDDTYERIIDKNSEYALDHFVEGFNFGVLLGLEIYGNMTTNNLKYKLKTYFPS